MSAKFLQIVSGAIKEAVAAVVGDIAVDGNLSSNAQDAVSKRHAQSHALDGTSDHSIGGLSSGYVVKSDGTKLAPGTNTDTQVAAAVTASHGAVTLDTTLAANLLSLATQVLSLGTHAANLIFAGPSSGVAAAPAFRSLGIADFPAGSLVQMVYTETGAKATGTTKIPFDDTIPQNNEGDEYMTLAITPKSASNILKIKVFAQISNNANQEMVIALFQDAANNALACSYIYMGYDTPSEMSFTHVMSAGTTSATTFKVRAGGNGTGTTTFNGYEGSRYYGGALASSIIIEESKA